MKSFVLSFLLTVGIGVLEGWTAYEPRRGDVSLETSTVAQLQVGCVELRKQEGAC